MGKKKKKKDKKPKVKDQIKTQKFNKSGLDYNMKQTEKEKVIVKLRRRPAINELEQETVNDINLKSTGIPDLEYNSDNISAKEKPITKIKINRKQTSIEPTTEYPNDSNKESELSTGNLSVNDEDFEDLECTPPDKTLKNNEVYIQYDEFDSQNMIELKDSRKMHSDFLADEFLKDHPLIYIGALKIYNRELGYFQSIDDHTLESLLITYVRINFKRHPTMANIREVLYFLKHAYHIQYNSADLPRNKYKVNVINGVIDLKTKSFRKHNPEFMFMNCINAKFLKTSDINITGTNFHRYLNQISGGNPRIEKRIQQIMGVSFSGIGNLKKAIYIYGASNSGKSVFLNLIKYILGKDSVSHLDFNRFSDCRFVGELLGKVANINFEVPNGEIKDIGVFKSLVSEDEEIVAKPIFAQPFSFVNRATLLFASNSMPKIKYSSPEDTRAFVNRLLLLHFPYEIPANHQDKNLLKKMKKEKDLIFTWSIKGLEEYIENGFKFDSVKELDQLLETYIKQINPIEAFIDECCNFQEGCYSHKETVDSAFIDFCYKYGYKSPNPSDFKTLKTLLGNYNGVTYRRINRDGINKYGYMNLRITGTN